MNDSFGKLRISSPTTYFEYYPSEVSQSNFCDRDIWINSTTGNSILSYNKNNTISLTCNESNSNVMRRSRMLMGNSLSKSRLLYFSGALLDRELSSDEIVNITVGMYSTKNSLPYYGYYIKTNGFNLYFCKTDNLVEKVIVQDDWNIDKFDGTGPSKKTLTLENLKKMYCFVIDEDWTGIGRVRMGFNINGINYFAHQFITKNLPCLITVKLPIAYSIIATNITSPITSTQIFSCAMIDGEYHKDKRHVSFHADNYIRLPNENKKFVLYSIRLNDLYKNSNIRLYKCNVSSKKSLTSAVYVEIQVHSLIGNIGQIKGTLNYKGTKESISVVASGDGSQSVINDGYILSSGIIRDNIFCFDFTTIRNEIVRFDLNYSDSLHIIIKQTTENNPEDFLCTLDVIEY